MGILMNKMMMKINYNKKNNSLTKWIKKDKKMRNQKIILSNKKNYKIIKIRTKQENN